MRRPGPTWRRGRAAPPADSRTHRRGGSYPDPRWLRFGKSVAGGPRPPDPRGAILPRPPLASFRERGFRFVRRPGRVRSARRPVRSGAGHRVRSGTAPRSFATAVRFVRRPPSSSRGGGHMLLYLVASLSFRDDQGARATKYRVRLRRRLGSFGAGIEFVRAGRRVRLVPVVEFVRDRSPTGPCSTFGSFGSGEEDGRGPAPAPVRSGWYLAQNTIGFVSSRRCEDPARPHDHLAQIAIGFVSPRACWVRSARGVSLRSPSGSTCQGPRGHDGLSLMIGPEPADVLAFSTPGPERARASRLLESRTREAQVARRPGARGDRRSRFACPIHDLMRLRRPGRRATWASREIRATFGPDPVSGLFRPIQGTGERKAGSWSISRHISPFRSHLLLDNRALKFNNVHCQYNPVHNRGRPAVFGR